MFSLHALKTTKRQLFTSVSLLIVGSSLFAACTVPTAIKSGAAQTGARPSTSQSAAKPSTNQPSVAQVETVMLHQDAKLGSFLTDNRGMTLYVFAFVNL